MSSFLRATLPLTLVLFAACPTPQGGGGEYGGGAGGGGNDQVHIAFQHLPDAVVEHSSSGVPRNDPAHLRTIFCQSRGADQIIFYHLIVSRHWHYLWLCSEQRPRRISSSWGGSRLKRWLRAFKNSAVNNSAGCSSPSHAVILRGNHESGIRASAHCDGQIGLTFPDGGRSSLAFQGSTAVVGGGGYQAPAPAGTCPVCQPCRDSSPRSCPATRCPVTRCPPSPTCPPRRACPAKDCRKEILSAGQKGFRQGVTKACRSICQEIYKKCRSINPKTALCHMVSEHCAEKCGK